MKGSSRHAGWIHREDLKGYVSSASLPRIYVHLAFKSRSLGVDIALGNSGPAAAKHCRHWSPDHPALADHDRCLPHDAHPVHSKEHGDAVGSARQGAEFL